MSAREVWHCFTIPGRPLFSESVRMIEFSAFEQMQTAHLDAQIFANRLEHQLRVAKDKIALLKKELRAAKKAAPAQT